MFIETVLKPPNASVTIAAFITIMVSAGFARASETSLDEIVVTAQKRVERLQDVPVPVTAISSDTLLDRNELRLQDYYTEIPGLSYTTDFRGAPSLTIRGLVTSVGLANPTVGVLVDDVPYGSSTGLGGGSSVPDLDPSDLARVEVLRGPQGALYGANSIGGLLKFVTVDPSTDRVSGRIEAGTSGVANGADWGYNFRGSLNVPLSDTVAIRASGFARQDPGYIDNVLTGDRGVNRVRAEGGRLGALWRPSDIFSLKIGALYQYSRTDGGNYISTANYFDPQTPMSDLQQSGVRGAGEIDRRVQAYSATGILKLGAMEITSITGYSINDTNDSTEASPSLGAFSELIFGVSGAVAPDHTRTNKFTQEIRFSAPLASNVDWLFGAFYTHEQSPYVQALAAANPMTGQVVGLLATQTSQLHYRICSVHRHNAEDH